MFRLIAGSLLIATPAIAHAEFQDVAAIDRAVANFTGHAIGSEGGARAMVDKRLKLATCGMVQLTWRAPNHDSVLVRCDDPAWRIFVPVIVPAQPAPVRAIAAAPAPKPEIVIKRGDPVTIEAGSPGFSITRDGIAMGDAAAGGRVLIDVDGAKRPVQAIAIEPGHATLPGFTQ